MSGATDLISLCSCACSYKGWGRQMHGQQVQVQQAWATL